MSSCNQAGANASSLCPQPVLLTDGQLTRECGVEVVMDMERRANTVDHAPRASPCHGQLTSLDPAHHKGHLKRGRPGPTMSSRHRYSDCFSTGHAMSTVQPAILAEEMNESSSWSPEARRRFSMQSGHVRCANGLLKLRRNHVSLQPGLQQRT